MLISRLHDWLLFCSIFPKRIWRISLYYFSFSLSYSLSFLLRWHWFTTLGMISGSRLIQSESFALIPLASCLSWDCTPLVGLCRHFPYGHCSADPGNSGCCSSVSWSEVQIFLVLCRQYTLDDLWVPLMWALMCELCFPPAWSFVISNDDNPSVHTVQNEDKLN